jgi:nucleotide-binding universal stress UspA family protein
MSIFPTRILLATDGSKEAVLAARTAVDVAEKTGSELHVIHVHRILPVPYAYRGRYTEPKPEPPGGEARALLNRQIKEIENAGGKVVGTYLRDKCRTDSFGQPRPRRGEAGPYGQRLRFRSAPRPLPRVGDTQRTLR